MKSILPRRKYIMACTKIIALLITCLLVPPAFAAQLELPVGQVALESEKGKAYFAESVKTDYLEIKKFFVTQSNGAYCGVASSVAVINALTGSKIIDQETYFKPNVKSSRLVKNSGMSLEQLTSHFKVHGMKTKMHNGDVLSLDEFRKLAINNFKDPDNFLVVNYYRRSLEQVGGGHISPVVAYHKATDSMLVMDTATYKYPPTWVKTEDLWKAANTKSWNGERRGLVEVSR